MNVFPFSPGTDVVYTSPVTKTQYRGKAIAPDDGEFVRRGFHRKTYPRNIVWFRMGNDGLVYADADHVKEDLPPIEATLYVYFPLTYSLSPLENLELIAEVKCQLQ